MQEGFLTWFYKEGIHRVIEVWLRLVMLTFETFSVEFLFKTLFSPWKRDVVTTVNASLQDIFQDIGFNLVSRFVGALVRTAAIVSGLVVTTVVFVIGGILTLAIVIFPIPLIPTYNYLKTQTRPLTVESLQDLMQRPQIQFILRHAGLNEAQVLQTASVVAQFDQNALLKDAQHFAQALRSSYPKGTHLLLAYFEQAPQLQKLLTENNLIIEELAEIVAWQERLWQKFARAPIFANPDRIQNHVHIGIDWAVGYTPALNRFARKIIEPADHREYLAHQDVVNQVITILRRSGKHNVILVGDPGVGKDTIIRAIARQFGDTKQFFLLDVNNLISGLSLSDDFETRLVGALKEAVSAGNVVLVAEQIEVLLDQNRGGANAVAILEPYLESPNLQLIATTTFASYHHLIEADPILAKNFERVDVTEPTDQQVMVILQDLTPIFEGKAKITISYQALRETVKVADRFLSQKRFPEKAIDILDEITSNQSPGSHVSTKQIDDLVSKKIHVRVGEPLKQEKQLLLNLEENLHRRLINQDQAVRQLADALRRVRAGVIPENKPIGSFLFLGPTGVGKTETAKTLAEAYFGSEQAMVRFDMSEYQNPQTSQQLIEQLSARLSEQPFTLLLLDEIEKAYPDILNLFLQVLDDARLTTPAGQTIDFRNTIIIATSNAGSEFIRESIAGKGQVTSRALLDYVQKQGIFKPEFLNRFTAVVAYEPLKIEQLKKVVDIILDRINKTLAAQQIKVTLDDAAKTKLAQIGFDPVFGARALERTMREKIENLVAQKILKGELQKGQTFTVSAAIL